MPNEMMHLLTADDGKHVPPPEFEQFGRFVGSWHIDAEFYDAGTTTTTTADWHFAPILGGRALQDVLVFPSIRTSSLAHVHRIGTSVRFYDVESGAWKVVWISPQSGTMYKLSGGVDGDRIVLEGDPSDGEPTRWIFEEMTADAFTWRGHVHDGSEWTLIQLMRASRIASDG